MAGVKGKAGVALGGVTLLAAFVALAYGAVQPADATRSHGSKAGMRLKTVVKGLEQPVFVTDAPGRLNRRLLFVVEKQGVVRIVKRGRLRRRPFLDIRDLVTAEDTERGLLSIAFDPGYAKNRRFYAYYTDLEGDVRISQFRRARSSRLRALPRARDVIAIPHPDKVGHNGGTLAFGPDRMLYMATGDGNPACDPDENAQNPDSLLGKLLRIEPLRKGGYRIPADNPFAASAAGRGEVYALGFRNPFRFSFDEPTGTIAIGDVGNLEREEVDYELLADANGANFGWDALEGSGPLVLDPDGYCRNDSPTAVPEPNELPVYEYSHEGKPGGCAVVGGIVVRDRKLKRLEGRYLFADHCRTSLRSFVPAIAGATGFREHRRLADAGAATSFFSGRRGRVYLTTLTGKLLRLRG